MDCGCRSGSCGACKVKVLRGEVGTSGEDGLEVAERQEGYVLCCVSSLKGDCTLDI